MRYGLLIAMALLVAISLGLGIRHASGRDQSSSSVPPLLIPPCADSSGQHLNYSGTSLVCGSSVNYLTGTTDSIGGGALLAGSCATGTATVTGATTSMVASAQASDGTNIPGVGTSVSAVVTATNTVTVSVCALLAVTPASKQYTVKVFP